MSAVDLDLPARAGWRRRSGLHHRLLALGSVLGVCLTVTCTAAAAGGVEPAVVVVLAPLVLWCALTPDSDLGILVVIVLALLWLGTVDGAARTGPWVLGAALGVLVFHTAMAAGTVAAPGARWSSAMAAAWSVRVAVVAAVTALVWGTAVVLDDAIDRTARGQALALVAVLVATAAMAWWMRGRSVGDR